jgi:TPR repeat protein
VISEGFSWRQRIKELRAVGNHAEAYKVLALAAESGDSSAYVELAKARHLEGAESAELNKLLALAEENLTPDDVDGHLSLHLAYLTDLGGPDDLNERKRLAFEHLLQVATVGRGVRDMLSVAGHYRYGLNEVAKDHDQAKYWYSIAASTGDIEAVREYAKYKKEQARQSS